MARKLLKMNQTGLAGHAGDSYLSFQKSSDSTGNGNAGSANGRGELCCGCIGDGPEALVCLDLNDSCAWSRSNTSRFKISYTFCSKSTKCSVNIQCINK